MGKGSKNQGKITQAVMNMIAQQQAKQPPAAAPMQPPAAPPTASRDEANPVGGMAPDPMLLRKQRGLMGQLGRLATAQGSGYQGTKKILGS